uniref:Uncharacterized protein n=1 Tax=Arundo donax TaxID=35708 RepID=A0A0A9F536_ARUDO
MRSRCVSLLEVKMKVRRLRTTSAPKLPVALGYSLSRCFVLCVASLPGCSNPVVKTLVSILSMEAL